MPTELIHVEEREALVAEIEGLRGEIRLLRRLATVLDDDIDHRVVFRKLLDCLAEIVPVLRAQIWVPDREAGELGCVFHFDGREVVTFLETHVLNPVIERDLVEGGAMSFGQGPSPAGPPGGGPAAAFLYQLAQRCGLPALVVPLGRRARLLGLLCLQVPGFEQELDPTRMRILDAVGHQASLALHILDLVEQVRVGEGLRREIEVARSIQHDLLPQALPRSARLDLFAGRVTAARVGGDYYDFLVREGPSGTPSTVGLLVADVTGHSVASAMIAMSFRSSFRHFHALELDADTLFQNVNRALYDEFPESGSCLSAFYAVLDELTLELSYTNAGHPRPFVRVGGTGEFRRLGEAGPLLGAVPDADYPLERTTLGPGDILVLYTDGVVEARSPTGDRFQDRRLRDAVARTATRSAREIYHQILKEVHAFQDDRATQDDMTLVVLKVQG